MNKSLIKYINENSINPLILWKCIDLLKNGYLNVEIHEKIGLSENHIEFIENNIFKNKDELTKRNILMGSNKLTTANNLTAQIESETANSSISQIKSINNLKFELQNTNLIASESALLFREKNVYAKKYVYDLVSRGCPIHSAILSLGFSKNEADDWLLEDKMFSAVLNERIAENKLNLITNIESEEDWKASAWMLEHHEDYRESFTSEKDNKGNVLKIELLFKRGETQVIEDVEFSEVK